MDASGSGLSGLLDEESCDSEDESQPTQSKKAKFSGAYKYKTKFKKEWSKTWKFIGPVPGDPYSFRCTVCSKNLSCSHQGIADVKIHISGKNHQKFVKGTQSQTQLSQFTVQDPLADKASNITGEPE